MRFGLTVLLVSMLGVMAAGTASAQTYSVILRASSEVPPTNSPATGSGGLLFDQSRFLSFNIDVTGLTSGELSSHIHGAAPPGENAGVLFVLPLGNDKVGSVGPLTTQQEADLNAGLLYVNVHTFLYPDGEIRGQILNVVDLEPNTWSRIKALYRRN